MKCLRCGAELGPPLAMNVPFRSLPGVVLAGIEGQTCASCGDTEYEIPEMEKLIQVIARDMVRKRARLTGAEVRFLRKSLGWSAADLAHRIGVRPETVSRWERGKLDINETADRLLRMFVLHENPIENYSLEAMELVALEVPSPFRSLFSWHVGWTVSDTPSTLAQLIEFPAAVVKSRLQVLRRVGETS